MRTLLIAVAMLASPAFAQGIDIAPVEEETVIETCPPVCKRGTKEHDVWWCEAKAKDACLPDQVNCGWDADANVCAPVE